MLASTGGHFHFGGAAYVGLLRPPSPIFSTADISKGYSSEMTEMIKLRKVFIPNNHYSIFFFHRIVVVPICFFLSRMVFIQKFEIMTLWNSNLQNIMTLRVKNLRYNDLSDKKKKKKLFGIKQFGIMTLRNIELSPPNDPYFYWKLMALTQWPRYYFDLSLEASNFSILGANWLFQTILCTIFLFKATNSI